MPNWNDEDLPALREIEAAVLAAWKIHPEINNYTVGRAYEAAHRHYRARQRGREPHPSGLDGFDLATFDAVQQVCEKLITAGPRRPPGISAGKGGPVPLETLVTYLRELARSVERHTVISGRCGYLTFIREFIAEG